MGYVRVISSSYELDEQAPKNIRVKICLILTLGAYLKNTQLGFQGPADSGPAMIVAFRLPGIYAFAVTPAQNLFGRKKVLLSNRPRNMYGFSAGPSYVL